MELFKTFALEIAIDYREASNVSSKVMISQRELHAPPVGCGNILLGHV